MEKALTQHHDHHHEHEEEGGRRQIIITIAAAILLAVAVATEHLAQLPLWQVLLVYLVPYILAGHHTIGEALEGIIHGDVFNEHFLMTVATAGAMAIGFVPGGEPEFAEAVLVMLLFQVGEIFEEYAEGQSRRSISHLMDIRPDTATLADGTSRPCEEVEPGTLITIRPGERVPIDGVVVSGTSALNTAALTGESLPRDVNAGDLCPSGCVNLQGVLTVRTTHTFSQSTASRIIALVQDAADHKSRSERFITRFARVYTPIVVLSALALAVLPPLLGGEWLIWIHRALIFLVVSCPCALVVSVPLTFFGAIGGASRRGILIKGANHIDTLARLKTVVFDKTGTLTSGQFAVEAVHGADPDELLHLAAHVEHYTTHPIGAALRQAFPREATDGCTVTDVTEIAGQGISAHVGNQAVYIGNSRLMESIGAQWKPCHHPGTIIHVALKTVTQAPDAPANYAGHIVVSDQPKADSAEAIGQLPALGIAHTVMLTGDRNDVAQRIAELLGITEWQAELSPEQKADYLRNLPESNRPAAFVGDGINDAPALALADIGLAMGALGSDAAMEAADVVLMDSRPSLLPLAVSISRRALRLARQNVAFAIGIKAGVLILAAMGLATMWMAVFADVGVTVLAVLNAMRALKS